ncbi:MAG: 50S ribosomal protein L19 [Candidatus Uhrbacteria bacterium]|nr:50S ribosomal protein L19 [Patescibacteria group bacterium]MBU1907268.1 50S ribosomal protein L19 [Patescibacteria group bacterium]
MLDTSNHKGKMIGAQDVRPGMTVRVHERILDVSPKGEERERTQVFEGIVLGISGAGNKRTFTVRKVSGGIGVEKIFPLSSPNVTKIEVVKIARVRQAKLGFLRNFKRRFKRKLKEDWVK